MLNKVFYSFFIICICLSHFSYSQNSKTFIYVDISSSNNMLDVIQDSIKKIIYQNEDDFILFISNGDKPLISNLRSKFEDNLKRLELDFFKAPDYSFDVELINKQLVANNFIFDLSNNSPDTRLDYFLNFHFFFDEDTYLDFKLDQRFIKKLLFSNALYFDSGLHQDCKVNIYKEDNFEIIKTYLND